MKEYTFNITVEFGKCDSGESEFYMEVEDNLYYYLCVAKALDIEFFDISEKDTIEQIKDVEDWEIDWDEIGISYEDFKKIDIDSIDFSVLDSVEDDAYEQEKDAYESNFGDDFDGDLSVSL